MKTASRRTLIASLLAAAATAAIPSFAIAQSKERKMTKDHKMMMKEKLGLEGYCPVCIIDAKKWVAGSKDHQVKYDGVTYRFPGAGPKAKFMANPAKYVPALGGDCIVCYAKHGKRVAGSVHHAAFHQNRLYLFPGKGELQAFLDAPADFSNTDLAFKGECSVCLKHADKHVPGKPEIAAIHKGLRYLFPSDKERQAFLKEPQQYAQSAADQRKMAMMMTAVSMIDVTGKTSCAGCEHGVTPIGSPEELGLAVTDQAGKVFVVEDAHERWPAIYKARFEGQTVVVKGRVVKTQGKINWIEPTQLNAI